MDTSHSGDEAIEIEKLARLISDELDTALIENSLIPAGECLPYDMLSPPARRAIKEAAEAVYNQIVYDTTSGILRVIQRSKGV
jgi:hypothetical protein